MKRLRQKLLDWAWAVVWRLPRPLRLRLGRKLAAITKVWLCQHEWVFAGWDIWRGGTLWQCRKCLKITRR